MLNSLWTSSAAGLDYTNTTAHFVILSTPFFNCTLIPIEQDIVVENREEFAVLLFSDDPSVTIGTPFATVEIIDDSGGSINKKLLYLSP